MSRYENIIRQTPRVYWLALEVKYVVRSHVVDDVVKMSDVKYEIVNMPNVRCQIIKCQMSNVKYFTSDVKMWKCHMPDAARLLISVGGHLRRPIACRAPRILWSETIDHVSWAHTSSAHLLIVRHEPIMTSCAHFTLNLRAFLPYVSWWDCIGHIRRAIACRTSRILDYWSCIHDTVYIVWSYIMSLLRRHDGQTSIATVVGPWQRIRKSQTVKCT